MTEYGEIDRVPCRMRIQLIRHISCGFHRCSVEVSDDFPWFQSCFRCGRFFDDSTGVYTWIHNRELGRQHTDDQPSDGCSIEIGRRCSCKQPCAFASRCLGEFLEFRFDKGPCWERTEHQETDRAHSHTVRARLESVREFVDDKGTDKCDCRPPKRNDWADAREWDQLAGRGIRFFDPHEQGQ